MGNNETPDDARIRLAVKEYLKMVAVVHNNLVQKKRISVFCDTLTEKMIMKSIDLETKLNPIKYNNLIQLKTNKKNKNI